jgi:hypothetical protein
MVLLYKGKDFEAEGIATFISYSRSESNFQGFPAAGIQDNRCSLQRRLWIPKVAYNGDFESKL